jgi:fatty acid desaturase
MECLKENTHFDYRSQLTKQQKQYFRKKFSEKSLLKGLVWNWCYLGSIYATIIMCYYVANTSSSLIWTFIVVFCSVIFCTRQMRGLENIVHFGSHNNFSKNKKLNDFMTNQFAAWPMLQETVQYRVFHATHHGEYASHKDPCRIRLENIGANTQEIKTNTQLLWLIAKWMPQYTREFYREISSDYRQIKVFAIWHGLVAIIITLLHSPELALFVTFSWMLIMFFLLPFLRSVAEISEHDYELGESVAETTFNNLGLLDHLLIHPAGDAWHSLHHLHPTVSWWKQRQAHNYLMENDPAYRNVINRDKLLQNIAHFPVHSKRLAESK